MKIAVRIIPLIFFSFYFTASFAQYPVYDQEPSSQRWSQINTPRFKVIYPDGIDSLAIGLTRRLESQYARVSASLDVRPRKLSLVLRSKTTIPNGFVTLAPRRSELFTMPPQDYNFVGTNSWLDLLAVHEFRHVVQFEKANRGFNKLLSTLFGQEALAGMSHIAVPQWFWEGDAVVTETALTHSGRGRIPEFNMAFRANLLERGAFSYNKQYLRSFKDFIPDHYVTGYYLVAHLRRKHDFNIWSPIAHDAFSRPYIPFAFSRAIKRHTGKNVVESYLEMTMAMDSLWRETEEASELTDAVVVTDPERRTFTNYMYPQVLPNGDILAFKEGLADASQLVRIKPDGREELEVITGLLANSGMLSAANDKAVWVEYRPDPRWGARTSNDIKIYDLQTKKVTAIAKRTRYSAAALSPDGTKIATIHTTEANKFYLSILDATSGAEIYQYANPENHFLSMPRWSADGAYIVALQTSASGKTIIQASVENPAVRELFPPSNNNYGHPVQIKNYVLYNLARNGIDNLFVYDLNSGQHFQVTSSRFGAFNASANHLMDSIYYNDYQVNGMDIAKIPLLPDRWQTATLNDGDGSKDSFIMPVIEQERNIDKRLSEAAGNLQIEKYKPSSDLFNIHSWGVLLTESDNFIAFGIRSRDVLGTTAFSAGYAHNPFENAGHAYGRVSYQGFLPVIDLEARIGNRRVEEKFRKDDIISDQKVEWNEAHASLGLRVPLNLTRSKYFRSLELGSKYEYTHIDSYSFNLRKTNQQADGNLQALQYDIRFSRLLRTSKRDLYSRWGQYLYLRYKHTPLDGDYKGDIFNAQAILYNPGLFKHHSFYLKGSFQHQDVSNNYRFASSMFYPRGYNYLSLENMYVASANYSLPLFYPDWSVGPFFYFQRLKGNAFYDRGWGTNPGFKDMFLFESIGLELSVDFNFMRFLPLLNLGVRYTYLPQANSFETQLVIGSLGF